MTEVTSAVAPSAAAAEVGELDEHRNEQLGAKQLQGFEKLFATEASI
jgi:hypothetical protein